MCSWFLTAPVGSRSGNARFKFGGANGNLTAAGVITRLARPGRRRHRVAAFTSAALPGAIGICSMPSASLAQATTPTPGVLPPWANSYGRSYSQWSAAQWQWELQQQNAPSSPIVDPNPGTQDQPEAVDCTLDQSGKVWFLAGISFLQPYSPPIARALFQPGLPCSSLSSTLGSTI
jgi:hypothetical protein